MEGDKLAKIKRHWFCHSRLKKDEIEWLIRQVELKQEIEEPEVLEPYIPPFEEWE